MYRSVIMCTLVVVCFTFSLYTTGRQTAHASSGRVDLIVYTDTTVPPFYGGHSLPSSGSKVTVTALVTLQNNNICKSCTYLWKKDGTLQNGVTATPDATFSFTPKFETRVVIGVEVRDSSGALVASNAQVLPIMKPELYFYEQNPLQGLLFRTLSNKYLFIGEEITLRAYPYFINSSIEQKDLLTAWSINGREVQTVENPYLITLRKEDLRDKTQLTFSVRNLKALLQGVEESISIRL